jgi:hypothetical protein
MSNPAFDHAKLLAPLLGYTSGVTIFTDKKPDAPDALVSVFNTGGYPALGVLDVSNPGVRRPGLMVHIRGAPGDYAGSRTKAEIVFAALSKKARYMANGNYYMSILAVGDLGGAEYDEKNRPNWYLNFEIMM